MTRNEKGYYPFGCIKANIRKMRSYCRGNVVVASVLRSDCDTRREEHLVLNLCDNYISLSILVFQSHLRLMPIHCFLIQKVTTWFQPFPFLSTTTIFSIHHHHQQQQQQQQRLCSPKRALASFILALFLYIHIPFSGLTAW
jgi:hypothetical protein